MSSNAIATALATVASAAPRLHSHRRGSPLTTSTAASGSTDSTTSTAQSGAIGNVGQLPAAGTSSLFSNLLQSLQAAAPAGALQNIATPATGGAATSAGAIGNLSQNVQAFTHSLFQALKQEQVSTSSPAAASGAAASAGAATSTASTAAPASAAYRSNLVASLQDLIQQLGPGGRPTSATSTLASSYQQLANAVSSSGVAGTSAAAAPSSDASKDSLQNFLGSLVQSLQNTGVHSLNGLGANVNANV